MTTGVAIALYNGSKFVLEQLNSIKNQTLTVDKVILCDDGSKDNTLELVEKFINDNHLQSSWQLIVNDKNLGYARNFYKAMSLCDTDIIFLCDQDDIWCENKVEKMTKIMENHSEILLLSSKFGMIDSEGNIMHGILERKSQETNELRILTHYNLLREYYWPGMLMCIRRDFFNSMHELVKEHTVAHDRVLAHFAAERNGFYEVDFIGAYHRRHNNNTAKEEHRVSKLLNINRKLDDMKDYREMLTGLLEISLPFSDESLSLIEERLALVKLREDAVGKKSLKLLWQLYKSDKRKLLRKVSFVCDIWLILFGKKMGEK